MMRGSAVSARLALAAAVVALASACNRAPDNAGLRSDSGAASAAGDVSLDSATSGTVFHGVKYPLTSDNYRKWVVAQAALDSLPEPLAMPRVDLRDPTDDDIDHTVAFLEKDDGARRAIERSGLSVRDFVLTSIALGQAVTFANDELVPPENRTFVRSNRDDIVRVRRARQFHVLDDDDEDDDHVREERGGEHGEARGGERHHHRRGNNGRHKGRGGHGR